MIERSEERIKQKVSNRGTRALLAKIVIDMEKHYLKKLNKNYGNQSH